MGSPHRVHLRLMGALLAGIGLFVYTSPPAPDADTLAAASARSTAPSLGASAAATARAQAARANARHTTAPGTDALDGGTTPKSAATPTTTAKHPAKANGTVGRVQAASRTGPSTLPTTTPAPHTPRCTDFRWQQDAQSAYVMNLADPSGLDGPPGPADDDGIACSLLPTDPSRPPSTPAGAKPTPPPPPPPVEGLPETPSLEQVLAPADNYFGVSTPQAPYDWKDFQIFAAAAQKLPSMVQFFQGWDQDFAGDQVIETWRRGALPVVSWEPRPTVQPVGPDSDNTQEPGFKLSTIINGSHDEYIDRYATAVRDLGLPVAIRFAHEMNGNWFPWSEERNGNTRGEYVAAWRHVHDRFTALGASNAIWIWSPNVVTSRPNVRLAPLYPGDAYVDWMGMVGYYRRVYLDDQGRAKEPTFANTYAGTVDELRSVAVKPIVITELGATEVGGNKPAWIQSVFQGLAENPDIIGFVWFDHSVNGNDWRIESSSAATGAFSGAVAHPRYHAGKLRPPKPGA